MYEHRTNQPRRRFMRDAHPIISSRNAHAILAWSKITYMSYSACCRISATSCGERILRVRVGPVIQHAVFSQRWNLLRTYTDGA